VNLSHVITEFSFGPHFPDITQPLDNSFEVTHDRTFLAISIICSFVLMLLSAFIAYQYFLHIVPSTYVAPRSRPVVTNQYSVTHYTRVFEHNQGTPGIFFKFDLDPMAITVHQRTTSFLQLIVRLVGVVGGLFTCMGFAIKVGGRAIEAVVGPDTSDALVPEAAASGVQKGKWRGGSLSARSASGGRVLRQGSGWVVEGATGGGGSPWGSQATTPASAYAQSPYSPFAGASPQPGSAFGPPPPRSGSGTPASANAPLPGSGLGLGLAPGPYGAAQRSAAPSPAIGGGNGHTPYGNGSVPGTPGAGYAYFPPTPGAAQGSAFPRSPAPNGSPLGFDRQLSNGSLRNLKKDD
jgi:hypothetical protein